MPHALLPLAALAFAAIPAGAQLTAVVDSYTVAAGDTTTIATPGVLANDQGVTDPASDYGPTLVTLLAAPAHHVGTFSLTPNGGFSYTHDGSAGATDSFTYMAFNDLESSMAVVTLDIESAAILIQATDDFYDIVGGDNVSYWPPGVLVNDVNSSTGTLTAVLVDPPTEASAFSLNANGGFTYIHDATSTAATDSFTYQATNGIETSAIATATFTISEAPPSGDDTGDGDVDTTGSGSFTLRFTSITAARAAARLGDEGNELLELRAPANVAAAVVSSEGFTDFPTESGTLSVDSTEAIYAHETREIFRECRKAALLAQARPDKYVLEIAVNLRHTSGVRSADATAIDLTLSDGSTISCSLQATATGS